VSLYSNKSKSDKYVCTYVLLIKKKKENDKELRKKRKSYKSKSHKYVCTYVWIYMCRGGPGVGTSTSISKKKKIVFIWFLKLNF
jgi:hypothetical protein